MNRLKKWLLLSVGGLSLLLGIIGIVLPGLPTTPFILLAAASFARSSPELHARLLQNPWAGPLLADWEQHHSIPRRIKWLITLLMTAMVLLSLSQLQTLAPRLIVGSLGLIGCVVVWRIPTRT